MGSIQEEEKLLLQPRSRKGGLRTIPFIIVNESFEKIASIGLTPNMIFYLMNEYHMEVTFVSTLLSLWSSLSNGLAIFGALLADTYLGRYRVIALGCFSSVFGITLLWLTAMFPQLRPPSCEQFASNCSHATLPQFLLLVLAYALISVGSGCNRPCSTIFGLDQLDNTDNPSNKMLLERFLNWYNISTSLSALLALSIIVYIQDHFGWKIGFGVPTLIMVLSVLVFLFGSPLYIKKEPTTSMLTPIFQVVVASFKNRTFTPPPVHEGNLVIYHRDNRNKLLEPSQNLRCLNKACMIADPDRDLNPDGSASDPWSLCTIEQVENLKALLRVFPMWSTGILLILSMNQCSFSTLQAKTMDRHLVGNFEIPPASFGMLTVAGLILSLSVYDRVIMPLASWWTGSSRGFSIESRMVASLVLSISALAVAATVERVRRKTAAEQGLMDVGQVAMSAMWLFPQYLIMGFADGLGMVAQTEFFFIRLPKCMSSIAGALYSLELGAASLIGALLVNVVNWITSSGGKTSWLESDINKGHIDYYYWLIAFIGCVNILYFFVVLRVFGGSEDKMASFLNELDGEDEGLLEK